ncbi:hypothetical protein Tco_0289452, partial [Tanacetum coccineum]
LLLFVVIDIHDFLCLYEWTGSKVHKEVHYDVRPTLQRFPFYYTPPAATNAAIPVPTPKDLATATPSSKVLAKADEDDEDACYEIPNITPIHSTATIPTGGNQSGGFVPFAVEGPSNRGKAIMSDVVDTPSKSATYPEDGVVAGSYKVSREEWDGPHQPTLNILMKEVFKDPNVFKTMVDQFPTTEEMVWNEALTDDHLAGKMSFLHCLMMSYGGELLAQYKDSQAYDLKKQVTGLNDKVTDYDAAFVKAKAKGKEQKKKIKSDALKGDQIVTAQGYLGDVYALIEGYKHSLAEKYAKILRLKSSPPEVQGELLSLAASAGFERGLSMDQTQDRMTMALKKISHFVPGGCWCLSSLSKELTVTPTPSSLELFSKDDPPSSTAALDQNKDWLSVMVDTADEEMVDAASDKPVEVFVQGVTHSVCEDKECGSPYSLEALQECKYLERVQGLWKEVQWRQREEQMSRIREQVILRTKSNSGIGPTSDPMSLEKTWDRENAKEAFTISHKHPDQYVTMGTTLTTNCKQLLANVLRENREVFAWTGSERTTVPRFVMEHQLKIYPLAKPVVQYPEWVADTIPIKLASGTWKVQVDYSSLNKVCAKDMYPLPEEGEGLASLMGYPYKCFLRLPKEYNQIRMAEGDEEKTRFRTGEGAYCFTHMSKVLKNSAATLQRMMKKVVGILDLMRQSE